jgi:hypothetical protein
LGQWYVWAALAIFVGTIHSNADIIRYDYVGAHFLMDPHLQENVPHLHAGSQEKSLEFPHWLKMGAMVVPLVGVLAVLVSLFHVKIFVVAHKQLHEDDVQGLCEGREPFKRGSKVVCTRNGHRIGGTIDLMTDEQDGFDLKNIRVHVKEDNDSAHYDWFGRGDLQHDVAESNPWSLKEVDELILLLIIMPAFFMVMATFALIRKLEVFTGSSFAGGTYESYAVWRQSTCDIDLACAAAFQYFTVCAFAKLCSKVFSLDDLIEKVESNELRLIVARNKLAGQLHQDPMALRCSQTLTDSLQVASEQHKNGLSMAGLQGIGAYILIGLLRSIFTIITAVMVELKQNHIQGLWLQFIARFQPVFFFASALCIYNWGVIQRFPDIREAFDNMPTKKFLAVRLLILCGDAQKSALTFVSTHDSFQGFMVTSHQADLIHILLLMIECSLVIVWNFFQWRVQGKNRATRAPESASSDKLLGVFSTSAATPLLDARF